MRLAVVIHLFPLRHLWLLHLPRTPHPAILFHMHVHPLITLIGVIVGVPLFGFIGLIFGPLLISLFLIVVRIYKREYGKHVAHDDDPDL